MKVIRISWGDKSLILLVVNYEVQKLTKPV